MARLFISYAREDLDKAKALYTFVTEHGHIAWLDKESLLPGMDWMLAIRKAIKDSDFFLACLSRASVNKRGYVQKELKQGYEALAEFPDGEVFVIPIRFDDCEVPARFLSIQYIDWWEEISKTLLLKALASRTRSDSLEENLRIFNLLSLLKVRTLYLYPELYRSARDLKVQSGPVSLLQSTLDKIMSALEELRAKGFLEFGYAEGDSTVIDSQSAEPIRRIQLSGIDLHRLRPLLMALGVERDGYPVPSLEIDRNGVS